MGFGSSYRTRSRQLTFILLIIFGGAVIILGLAVLGIGLAITHNDTFHDTQDLKAKVETTIDYVQYWVGLPVRNHCLFLSCCSVMAVTLVFNFSSNP
jgi:hypothetical protein